MLGGKTSAMPGAKVVSVLDRSQVESKGFAATPKSKALTATPNLEGNAAISKPAPKKRRMSLVNLISAINRGSITGNIVETISNFKPVQFPGMHEALKYFDASPGVFKALHQIGTRFEVKYNKHRRYKPSGMGHLIDSDIWKLMQQIRFISEADMTSFGELIKETGIIAELGAAFLAADLPVQSATVYMCLISKTNSWLRSRHYRGSDYTAFDWEKELFVWGEGLTLAVIDAVISLKRRSHRLILTEIESKLSGFVSMQPLILIGNREGPLSECRKIVKSLLNWRTYVVYAQMKRKYAESVRARVEEQEAWIDGSMRESKRQKLGTWDY